MNGLTYFLLFITFAQSHAYGEHGVQGFQNGKVSVNIRSYIYVVALYMECKKKLNDFQKYLKDPYFICLYCSYIANKLIEPYAD